MVGFVGVRGVGGWSSGGGGGGRGVVLGGEGRLSGDEGRDVLCGGVVNGDGA